MLVASCWYLDVAHMAQECLLKFQDSRHHISSLKLVRVGVLTPWELEISTDQVWWFPLTDRVPVLKVSQNTTIRRLSSWKHYKIRKRHWQLPFFYCKQASKLSPLKAAYWCVCIKHIPTQVLGSARWTILTALKLILAVWNYIFYESIRRQQLRLCVCGF